MSQFVTRKLEEIARVKPRVVNAITITLEQLPQIRKDKERLLKYLHTSLDCEGVSKDDIERLATTLYTGE